MIKDRRWWRDMIANVLKGHDMKEEKKKTLHVCVSKCYLNFSLFSMHLLPSVWHVSVNFSRPSFLIVSSNFKMSFQFLINILVLWQCVVLGEINSKAAYFIFDQEKSFELRKLCILVFYLSNFPFFYTFEKAWISFSLHSSILPYYISLMIPILTTFYVYIF